MSSDVNVLRVEIGQRIRACRRRLKLTQAQLAERSGLTANYVAHLERGTRGLSLETLLVLARAFRCRPRALLS